MARQGALRIVQGGIPLPEAPSLKLVKGGLENLGGTVAKHGDDIASTAGKVFDIIGKVATVIDLIATLGTIIRMEQIARNSIARDEELQRQIQQLSEELNGLEAMLSGQLDAILGDTNAILGQTGLIPSIQSQTSLIPSIQSQTSLIPSIQSQTSLIPNIQSQTGLIPEVLSLAQLIPQIAPSVIAQIAPETCKALRNPNCFNLGDFGSNESVDLQPVLNKLNALQQSVNSIDSAVGGGSGYCNDSFSFGNLTHGLELLVCGGSGSSFYKALEDYFANNEAVDLQPVIDKVEEKGNEVIAEVKKIPEPYLFVPQSWQYRIAGNRPQLLAGMYEKGKDSLSPSKWDICIPHVRSDISSFSLEDLKTYFRPYRRGKFYARATLNDGSAFVIHADSTVAATNYINRLIELIDSSQIPEKDFISTGENPRISRSVNVEVRAFGYYATGRKQGEKPTKRWYFPLVETAPA